MHDAVLGLIAAILAVLTVHEGAVAVFHRLGLLNARAYSMAPVKPFGVPTIVNRMFWGGMWGIVYALLHDLLPDGPVWAQGMLFGWAIFLIVNCVVLPIVRDEPIFYDFNFVRMASAFVILSLFGTALAVIYGTIGGAETMPALSFRPS